MTALNPWARPVMSEPIQNPRVAYCSWLMITYVPEEFWPLLQARLNAMQQQAVHMTAIKLRESGMGDVADLIDPGKESPDALA